MSKNFFKHLKVVTKHRFLVFKYSCKVGIPFLGLIHDLSKYSYKEFSISEKNYTGYQSPLLTERRNNGMFSECFVHHTNKNKHHFEYYIDYFGGDVILKIMPYKYNLEYVIDVISASKTYNGKKFNNNMPYEYFNSKNKKYLMHPASKEFALVCLKKFSEDGFKHLKKKDTKKLYEDIKKRYSLTYKVPFYSINNKYDFFEITKPW